MEMIQETFDLPDLIRQAFFSMIQDVWTALPGEIVSFDAEKQTAEVQPTIKIKTKISGEVQEFTLPILPDVPVVFPHGGGFSLTFPVKKGDECLLVFSARCIDGWWNSGGVQSEAEIRNHSLSDGFALLGPCSQKKKISNYSTSEVVLKKIDDSSRIAISDNGIQIETEKNVKIKAASVEIKDDVTIDGVKFLDHTHDITAAAQVTAPQYILTPNCFTGLDTDAFPYGQTAKVKTTP